MAYRNRRSFVAGLSKVLDNAFAEDPSEAHKSQVLEQIHGLLDDYLLESQPIGGTEATILIADIRGFTELSATNPPELVTGLLNRFFVAMTEVIHRHDGVIDKFMGDAIMALFGAPERRSDDLLRALACAVDMQKVMVELNAASRARNEPQLFVGIAVNNGPVMVGSFGSPQHSEYTAIGDAVNMASRIEAYSLRGQILLSDASRRAAGNCIEIGNVNRVSVKGRAEPIELYELRSITYPERMEVPQVEVRRSPRIKVDLPLTFRCIEKKIVLPQAHPGYVRDIGYNGMLADFPFELPARSDIVFSISAGPIGDAICDLYAKVLRVRPYEGMYRTSLEFTSVGTPCQRAIKRFIDDTLWGH